MANEDKDKRLLYRTYSKLLFKHFYHGTQFKDLQYLSDIFMKVRGKHSKTLSVVKNKCNSRVNGPDSANHDLVDFNDSVYFKSRSWWR